LFDYSWNNDFAAARNFSLSKVTSDYILFLDADEWLDQKSYQELLLATQVKNKSYLCNILNYGANETNNVFMKYTRLFCNKERIKFEGKVHEQIEKSLKKLSIPIIDSNILIHHDGYNLDKDNLANKAQRNLNILLTEYGLSPSSYLAFHIGNTYKILNNEEEAYQYFQKAYTTNNLPYDYKLIIIYNLFEYYNIRNDLQNAQLILDRGIYLCPNDSRLLMMHAELCEKKSLLQESLSYIKKAYECSFDKNNDQSFNLKVDINKRQILMSGLNTSLKANIIEYFNYFLSSLSSLDKSNEEQELIQKLITGSINKSIYEELFNYIDHYSISFYLKLLKVNDNLKIELLLMMSDKLINNEELDTEIGLAYLNMQFYERALEIFEKILSRKNYNPAIIFFTCSAYLGVNRYNDAKNLIIKSKKIFKNNPILIPKFDQLYSIISEKQIKHENGKEK